MIWFLLAAAAAAAASAAASDDAPSPASASTDHGSVRLNLAISQSLGTHGAPAPSSAPVVASNVSDADLDAAFAAAKSRSAAARKASEDEGQVKIDDLGDKAEYALSLLGPAGVAAGVAFRALVSWGYGIARAFSDLLYGDPGWNDPDQVERAKRAVVATLALGFMPTPFADDLDAGAMGYADRLETQLAQLRSPAMPPEWPAFLTWLASPAAKQIVQDATYLQLFPATFEATVRSRALAGALGRLLATAYRRDPVKAQRAASDAVDQVWKAPNGSPLAELRWQDHRAQLLAYIVARAMGKA